MKSRSPYGVEDMAGNVFEYTSTLRSQIVRTVSVMKGCSWDDLPGFCRAAYFHTRPIQSRHILFGFRLVQGIGGKQIYFSRVVNTICRIFFIVLFLFPVPYSLSIKI